MAWNARTLVALVTFVMFVAGFPVVAAAHSAGTYYPREWQRDLSVRWAFTPQFPGGAWRSRVRDGAAQWNAVGQPMRWVERSQWGSNFNPFVCPGSYQKNGIHWRDIDALGVTVSCTFSGSREIYSANIAFDRSGPDWYTGTGDAGDGFLNACWFGCETDAWSIASHEFGHATGFSGPFADGHFDPDASICEDNSAQHTMCPYYSGGTERFRTLARHDRHTFAAAY